MKDEERFDSWKAPKIKDGVMTKYNWIVQNIDNFELGYKTDIGSFSYINAKFGVIVEDYVQIGSHCSIYSISTIDNQQGKVYLKRNCKIGTHSTIMPNITIGENSIVGAYSLVLEDIPDNVVAFGIPAKVIRNLND